MVRWSVDQVGEWLRLIGFEKQITTFKDRHIDGNALKQLTVCDIPQLLIVTNDEDQTIEKPTIGEIRRFQKSLEEWREICGQSRSRKKTKKSHASNNVSSSVYFYDANTENLQIKYAIVRFVELSNDVITS
ncbi:unnamed protein product [Rotaria magnacalcarata]|uniref:SAM domain-containing protein n=2 Tax=Rotaria magnacalcarata TaxID=392030 RepID=A0A819SSE0_9BILA|nr:unnamed protein product [Rotaria magnacalcarata]